MSASDMRERCPRRPHVAPLMRTTVIAIRQ